MIFPSKYSKNQWSTWKGQWNINFTRYRQDIRKSSNINDIYWYFAVSYYRFWTFSILWEILLFRLNLNELIYSHCKISYFPVKSTHIDVDISTSISKNLHINIFIFIDILNMAYKVTTVTICLRKRKLWRGCVCLAISVEGSLSVLKNVSVKGPEIAWKLNVCIAVWCVLTTFTNNLMKKN